MLKYECCELLNVFTELRRIMGKLIAKLIAIGTGNDYLLSAEVHAIDD